MNPESHEHARRLLDAHRVEGISSAEQDWLERHLASCDECSSAAEGLDATIQSLRSLPVVANSELVRQTRLAVRNRAEERRAARSRSVPLWIATALSSGLMIFTSSYVWQVFAWIGSLAGIPNAVWLAGFLVWWFLPATILAAAAAWRQNTTNMEER
jgi:anti-sigma factor RsiW